MPGTITKEDHRRLVEQQLQAYAAAAVRRVLARQRGFVAPPGLEHQVRAYAEQAVRRVAERRGGFVAPAARRGARTRTRRG